MISKARIRAALVTVGALGLIGSQAGVAHAEPPTGTVAVAVCSFSTWTGNWVTAVDGGGRTTEVLHTDAVTPRGWENLTVEQTADHYYAFRTVNGHYLTANSGGGRVTGVMRSNETAVRSWEKFSIVSAGNNRVAFRTINGHYLTANNGGGLGGGTADALRSNATTIRAWETFGERCTNPF